MTCFCLDRDLLAIEPIAFTGGGFPGQNLASGDSCIFTGTSCLTGGDLRQAGVEPGMVICACLGSPQQTVPLEIVTVGSTTLSVSTLRSSSEAPPISPGILQQPAWYIRSFAPQIATVSALLAEKLRQACEPAGIAPASFADSHQLRLAAAFAALADIFLARSDGNEARDANWIKSQHYRRQFVSLQLQLRLAVDRDGDGLAEQTRTLGNVTLRRV